MSNGRAPAPQRYTFCFPKGSLPLAHLFLFHLEFHLHSLIALVQRGTEVAQRMNHSLDIGKKLKRFRTLNRMSIRDIARKSGCAVSTVAQIELNQISPTIGTLENICRAFDITVSDFMRPAISAPKPIFISNAREECAVALRWTGAKLLRVTADHESSFTGLIYCLEPGRSTPNCYSLIPNEQLCFVLKGQVSFRGEEASCELKQGEGLYFNPQHPHGWSNPGDSRAELLVFNPYRFVLFEQREEDLRWHLHVKRERRKKTASRGAGESTKRPAS